MDRSDLERLTLQELRQAAAKAGVPRAGRSSRQALIDALLEAGLPDPVPALPPASPAEGPSASPSRRRARASRQKSEATSVPERVETAAPPAPAAADRLEASPAPAAAPVDVLEASAAPLEPGVHAVLSPAAVEAGAFTAPGALVEALETPVIEPYIDRGPPLPPRLHEDYIMAAARDPWTVLVMWELSDETRLRPVSDGSGRDFLAGSWALRVFGRRGEVMTATAVDWRGDWWVNVPPDTPGVACIGAISPSGRFCPVLWSQPFRTPRDVPSLDRSVHWMRVELRREQAPAETLIREAPALMKVPEVDARSHFGVEPDVTEKHDELEPAAPAVPAEVAPAGGGDLEAVAAESVPVGEAGTRQAVDLEPSRIEAPAGAAFAGGIPAAASAPQEASPPREVRAEPPGPRAVPPAGPPQPFMPVGASERFIPVGASERFIPPGASERFIPVGASERFIPPGASERFIPVGASERFAPVGASERFALRTSIPPSRDEEKGSHGSSR